MSEPTRNGRAGSATSGDQDTDALPRPVVSPGEPSRQVPAAATSVVPSVAVPRARSSDATSTIPASSGSEFPSGTAAQVPAAAAWRLWARRTAFNWRLFVVRFVAAAVAIVVTVYIVPGLGFTSWQPGQFGVVTVTYALLVAVLKPLLEFLALRFLVATYGLIVIVVNATVLFVLARLLDQFIVYDRLWQLLLGGLVVGVLGLVLETVLGATPPVLDTRGES